MEAIKHKNCNILGKADGCFDLPVEQSVVEIAGVERMAMNSYWQPTPEELAALNSGACLRLSVILPFIPMQALDVVPTEILETDLN